MTKSIMPYANNKDIDEPAYQCSLFSTFVIRFQDIRISVAVVYIQWHLQGASVAELACLNW